MRNSKNKNTNQILFCQAIGLIALTLLTPPFSFLIIFSYCHEAIFLSIRNKIEDIEKFLIIEQNSMGNSSRVIYVFLVFMALFIYYKNPPKFFDQDVRLYFLSNLFLLTLLLWYLLRYKYVVRISESVVTKIFLFIALPSLIWYSRAWAVDILNITYGIDGGNFSFAVNAAAMIISLSFLSIIAIFVCIGAEAMLILSIFTTEKFSEKSILRLLSFFALFANSYMLLLSLGKNLPDGPMEQNIIKIAYDYDFSTNFGNCKKIDDEKAFFVSGAQDKLIVVSEINLKTFLNEKYKNNKKKEREEKAKVLIIKFLSKGMDEAKDCNI